MTHHRPGKFQSHITWFSQHRNAASRRGGGEGLRLQSQEGQDLSGAASVGHLMFMTSTEDQTVHLTNKDMTKDSERFSPWFHSPWNPTFSFPPVPLCIANEEQGASSCSNLCLFG
jgi:hypothetical protein